MKIIQDIFFQRVMVNLSDVNYKICLLYNLIFFSIYLVKNERNVVENRL